MCAGNSPEEALVQGLSEIIERVVQRRIFTEKPALPDVPEEYIQQFPYVYEIIQKLKEQEKEGYYYFIKDCSFGGQYPVAALIVYEKNTGKYGIKLGCHPDFGVAIERTLTEATQGQDLAEYSKRSSVDFTNNHVDEWKIYITAINLVWVSIHISYLARIRHMLLHQLKMYLVWITGKFYIDGLEKSLMLDMML